jgi:predicted dithiol-disulfide oxidoreductase (DUF899 family)
MTHTPICWLSETYLFSDDLLADMRRQVPWYTVDIYIQNPDNTRTLEDLKKDKETMQLLTDLLKTNAMEIKVYADESHEAFNIEVFFEDQESCEACATTYSGGQYGAPTGDIFRQWKMVEKTS